MIERADRVLKENNNLIGNVVLTPDDIKDRTKAFEKFRKSYRKNEAMEENKSLLKEKMVEGKRMGQEGKAVKDKIHRLTNKIEEIRKEKAMRGLVDADGNIMKSDEEDELQEELLPLKAKY